jgi:hypothetical protein
MIWKDSYLDCGDSMTFSCSEENHENHQVLKSVVLLRENLEIYCRHIKHYQSTV